MTAPTPTPEEIIAVLSAFAQDEDRAAFDACRGPVEDRHIANCRALGAAREFIIARSAQDAAVATPAEDDELIARLNAAIEGEQFNYHNRETALSETLIMARDRLTEFTREVAELRPSRRATEGGSLNGH